LMVAYVWWVSGQWEMRWRVEIGGVCGGVGPLLKLAVPSCLGICLEWWWYEIVTLLAGYLPNPTLAVAATGILIQTTSMMYTVPMALAGCVSARVIPKTNFPLFITNNLGLLLMYIYLCAYMLMGHYNIDSCYAARNCVYF
jgi:hypothetical protein